MRILAIADEVDEALYTDRLVKLRPDIVVSCGDLPFEYLEFIVSRLDVPLIYVPGNHDPSLHPADSPWMPLGNQLVGPQGCDSADGRVVEARGLRIAGLGGSIRYKPGPNQYSQAEMHWRALNLEFRVRLKRARGGRRLDILLTHAPPFGMGVPKGGAPGAAFARPGALRGDVHVQTDAAHVGLAAINRIIKVLKPAVHIYGHVHPYGRSQLERRIDVTRTINAVPWRVVEI